MTESFHPSDPLRFERAIKAFDALNAQDPNQECVYGSLVPHELWYAQRLTEWVLRLEPDAGEALQLAARCQHLCRWEIPRETYPAARAGYLKWRQDLKLFHADKAERVLENCGYDRETIQSVRKLNLKQDLSVDPDMQVLEDALCMVFLENQLAPLAARTDEEKMLRAIQKSWAKMSARARELALSLPLAETGRRLIQKALKIPKDQT